MARTKNASKADEAAGGDMDHVSCIGNDEADSGDMDHMSCAVRTRTEKLAPGFSRARSLRIAESFLSEFFFRFLLEIRDPFCMLLWFSRWSMSPRTLQPGSQRCQRIM